MKLLTKPLLTDGLSWVAVVVVQGPPGALVAGGGCIVELVVVAPDWGWG